MPHHFALTNTASVFHAWVPPMLKQHSPRWNRSLLRWHESLFSALAASFLFREQPRPSCPLAFFLPAARQRISATGDEWAYDDCTPTYLTLSPQRAFSRSFQNLAWMPIFSASCLTLLQLSLDEPIHRPIHRLDKRLRHFTPGKTPQRTFKGRV